MGVAYIDCERYYDYHYGNLNELILREKPFNLKRRGRGRERERKRERERERLS